MSRWLAIVNPAAGLPGSAQRLAAALAAAAGGSVELVSTAAPGDALRLARAATGYAGLVAVGGDGTIGEVLNGMDRARQLLALVPAGHGNCLARDLGMATTRAALAAFCGAASVPVDLIRARIEYADGRIEQRLCASTLAVGYVADVVATGRQRLAWLGRHAYTAAALATRPRRLRLRIDAGAGTASRPLTNLVINNTAHLANFRAFHAARLDDGALDVLTADYGWPRQLLHNLAILAGSRRFGPGAMWQALAVSLECEAPARLMADGELAERVVRLSATCEPAGIRCRVPAP